MFRSELQEWFCLGERLLLGLVYRMSTYPHTQSHAWLQDLDMTVWVLGTELMLSALPGCVSLIAAIIACCLCPGVYGMLVWATFWTLKKSETGVAISDTIHDLHFAISSTQVLDLSPVSQDIIGYYAVQQWLYWNWTYVYLRIGGATLAIDQRLWANVWMCREQLVPVCCLSWLIYLRCTEQPRICAGPTNGIITVNVCTYTVHAKGVTNISAIGLTCYLYMHRRYVNILEMSAADNPAHHIWLASSHFVSDYRCPVGTYWHK